VKEKIVFNWDAEGGDKAFESKLILETALRGVGIYYLSSELERNNSRS
jgi:spore germination protein YaaH